jgi:hypothetical protein
MIDCPKCNNPFEEQGKWGIKKFCSRRCANSKPHSEESKLKIASSLKSRARSPQTPEEIARRNEKIRSIRLQRYQGTAFEDLGSENRRRRVFEEQDYKCIHCGIDEWFGHKISLELEHKDGNTENNSRINLEGRCPNCHSITDTWRGRNKPARNGIIDVTDEFLLQCLNDTDNIRQGLLKSGLAAKGNNYQRAKKLLGII